MAKTGEIDLDRLAEEELLREAKIAAARAEVNGVLDWQKCPLLKTNKTFLYNTVVSTVKFNMKKTKVKNITFKAKSSTKNSVISDSLKKTTSKKDAAENSDSLRAQGYRAVSLVLASEVRGLVDSQGCTVYTSSSHTASLRKQWRHIWWPKSATKKKQATPTEPPASAASIMPPVPTTAADAIYFSREERDDGLDDINTLSESVTEAPEVDDLPPSIGSLTREELEFLEQFLE